MTSRFAARLCLLLVVMGSLTACSTTRKTRCNTCPTFSSSLLEPAGDATAEGAMKADHDSGTSTDLNDDLNADAVGKTTE